LILLAHLHCCREGDISTANSRRDMSYSGRANCRKPTEKTRKERLPHAWSDFAATEKRGKRIAI